MRRLVIFLLIVTAFLTALKAAEGAGAEGSDNGTPLAIGLIPEHNIFKQIERYEPLAEYLSDKIGRPIELKILSRYGNIVDNFTSMGLDGAFFGSFTYALAHKKIGVEVIARPQGEDGVSTYYGLIFVRKDSGIKTARDMKGKVFVFVDKATTAGYLLPLEYFIDNGVDDYKQYFKETYFSGSHEAAIYDVLNGKADIGSAKNTVYFRIAESDSGIERELVILRKSPAVPENALAVSRNLAPSVKEKLKGALLGMHEDPEGERALHEFGTARFIVTTDEDYQAVFQYAEHVGLDLSTYDYIND